MKKHFFFSNKQRPLQQYCENHPHQMFNLVRFCHDSTTYLSYQYVWDMYFLFVIASQFTMHAYYCYCGVSQLYKLQQTQIYSHSTQNVHNMEQNNEMTNAQETHTPTHMCRSFNHSHFALNPLNLPSSHSAIHTKIKNNMLICTMTIYNAHSFRANVYLLLLNKQCQLNINYFWYNIHRINAYERANFATYHLKCCFFFCH